MWTFLFIIVMIGLVLWIAIAAGVESAKQKADENLARSNVIRENFDIDELYMSSVSQAFIGFSFERGVVLLGGQGLDKEYLFSEISSVDVIQNGMSITKTNRGSQLLGAAVGGLAFGGIGLLAGALSGSSRASDRVNEITLKVTVDDNVKPIHVIPIFKWTDPKGLEANSPLVKPLIDQADRLHAHLVNGMRRAEEARVQSLPAPAAPVLLSASSYGDQVKQLWDLHQAGALTLDEFETQKAALSR